MFIVNWLLCKNTEPISCRSLPCWYKNISHIFCGDLTFF